MQYSGAVGRTVTEVVYSETKIQNFKNGNL